MYKILLADDEFRVCKMLEKFIKESGLGLQVVGTASNGKDAFELISKEAPDIVVTDVRMPILDGIELAKRTRAMNNDCALIFISGYRQFEYAHSALSFGVKHYLLKPINKQDFLDSLRKIIESFDNTKYSKNLSGKQYNGLPRAALGVRHSLLKSLLSGTDTVLPSIEECNRRFLFAFQEGNFQTFLGILDSEDISEDFFHTTVADAMDNIIQVLNKHCAEQVFEKEYYIENNLLFGILNYDKNIQPSEAAILKCFNEINQMLGRQGDLRLSLAISPATDNIQELQKVSVLAADAVKCRIRIGNGRIIFAENLSYSKRQLALMAKDEIIKHLESDNHDYLLNYINSLLEQSCDQTIHPKYKYNILFDLQAILEEYVAKNSCLNDIDTTQLYKVILTAKTEQCMNTAYMSALFDLLSNITAAKQKVDMLPIKNAKEYISAHIDNPLTLLDVASHVNLTPNYFSTLFRNETGCNYLDYLIALRIDKAKALLLTDLSLSEISEQVGYPDAKYFTKIFKKKVGIKPLDYRKFHYRQ